MNAIELSEKASIYKGIGIILVVLGHCCIRIQPYVYMFHMALFFFIGGGLYNSKKYDENVSQLIGTRIKSLYARYMPYMIILGILHNTFVDVGVINDIAERYSLLDFGNHLLNYVFFDFEPECGPLWFVVPYVLAQIIYGINSSINHKWFDKNKLFLIIISIIYGIVAEALIFAGVRNGYHLEIACLMQPVMLLGDLSDLNIGASKLINVLFAILDLIVLILTYRHYGEFVSLGSDILVHPIIFWIVTLCGIHLVAFCVKMTFNINGIKRVLIVVGNVSFDIMALHVLVFRMLWAIDKYVRHDYIDNYTEYVFQNWVICFGVGVLIPLFIFFFKNKVKNVYKKMI